MRGERTGAKQSKNTFVFNITNNQNNYYCLIFETFLDHKEIIFVHTKERNKNKYKVNVNSIYFANNCSV